MALVVAPDLLVRVDGSASRSIEIVVGSGTNRRSYSHESEELAAFLACAPEVANRDSLAAAVAEAINLEQSEAGKLTDFLLLEGLFVEKSSSPDEGAERWKRSGWQEALAYHRASQNLRFNRDAKNYLNAITKQLLRSERGEDYRQPGPFKGYFSDDVLPLGELGEGAPTSKITLYEVFRRTRPFRPYAPGPLRADQLVAIMRHTYGVDAECEGLLGPYFRRTTPSGGARHPIEAYVLVNEVCGVSAGLYHYAPLPHALRPLRYGDYRETLTQNCFDKPGIKTASVVIVLTVRWLRHMWKYRYAKSYRMVLMDVGHAIQTNLLNAHAVGVQCFPCPSIFDQGLEEFLGLRNPLDEGVIYAIGMGPAKPIEEGDTYFPEHQF